MLDQLIETSIVKRVLGHFYLVKYLHNEKSINYRLLYAYNYLLFIDGGYEKIYDEPIVYKEIMRMCTTGVYLSEDFNKFSKHIKDEEIKAAFNLTLAHLLSLEYAECGDMPNAIRNLKASAPYVLDTLIKYYPEEEMLEDEVELDERLLKFLDKRTFDLLKILKS